MLVLFINLSLGLHSSFFRGLFVEVTAPSAFCYLLLYFHSLSPPVDPAAFFSAWLILSALVTHSGFLCQQLKISISFQSLLILHQTSCIFCPCPMSCVFSSSKSFTSLSDHCSHKCFFGSSTFLILPSISNLHLVALGQGNRDQSCASLWFVISDSVFCVQVICLLSRAV